MVDDKKYAVLTTDGSAFVWDYKEQKVLPLEKDKIPAISAINDPQIIENSQSVMFPKNLDDIGHVKEDEQTDEKISLGSKSSQEEKSSYADDDNDEQSILIQKLREHVIRFERLTFNFFHLTSNFPHDFFSFCIYFWISKPMTSPNCNR